ncbi:TonB-dependent siderophore receptor [Pusillimonas sp. TS35]|nr:TonB-dependent siderophore receptor [Pusillimonas sp. TS35]
MALAALPLALSLVFSGIAQAQTVQSLPSIRVKSSGTGEETYNPPVAASATKIDAPLRDIPQTVNVVPQAVIEDQRALSLQDVLKNVPGVGFSHGDGQRDQVTIRGFTAIADQYVDGFRDDALYFRDLSNIDRVEVIKGPAAVLYGRGSAGGLINRITKKPGIDITEGAVSYGSNKDRRAEFDVGRESKNGSVAWRLTGARQKSDSYRDQQFLDRTAISPSLEFRLNEDSKLLLQADYLEDSRVTDFGVPAFQGRPVDVDPSTYYGAGNARDADTSTARVKSFTATFTHRFNDNWSLRNGLRYYHYTLIRDNTLPQSVNEARRTVTLTRSNVRRAEHGWSNQTELMQKADFAGMKHQILYGMEIGQQNKDARVWSAGSVATVSLFNPVLPNQPAGVSGRMSADNLGTFNTLAFYTQDLITLNDQWKALVGLRHDRYEQQTNDRLPGRNDLSRTDTAWSPRAGLVWQPDDAQSYYLSWSRSFQPSGEAFSVAANNADLGPETTTNTEVGAKYDFWGGRASATVSLVRLERKDIKTTDPANPTRLVPIGKQRTDGLELTFSGDLTRGWKVLAGYAYLDARVIDSIGRDAGQDIEGKRATLTPRHSGNLWLTKDFANGFGAGGGVNLIGARFANPGNTVTLPGYITADIAGWYRNKNVEVQLNLNNVFDTGYYVSGHGTSPNLNLPGAPRNVMLTLRYRM